MKQIDRKALIAHDTIELHFSYLLDKDGHLKNGVIKYVGRRSVKLTNHIGSVREPVGTHTIQLTRDGDRITAVAKPYAEKRSSPVQFDRKTGRPIIEGLM